jgi:hypothetical protein
MKDVRKWGNHVWWCDGSRLLEFYSLIEQTPAGEYPGAWWLRLADCPSTPGIFHGPLGDRAEAEAMLCRFIDAREKAFQDAWSAFGESLDTFRDELTDA